MLTGPLRQQLLAIARQAIASRLDGSTFRPGGPLESLPAAAGVFVTLRAATELRGCIGTLDPSRPLVDLIVHAAVAAAFDDPRFPPLDRDEFGQVLLEISVLSPPELVLDPGDLEVGRHGLIVEHGARRGLLLPQVPIEWDWNRETFLAQTCLKAGLPHDAWECGATLMRFEAEVFGETDTADEPKDS
jgi:AmmeMemoRadiSam system protein A